MDEPSIRKLEMPDRSLQYHSEYLLEAHEVQRQPFNLSGLGRLPTEVRTIIYEIVMAFDTPEKDRRPLWLVDLHKPGFLRATLPSTAGSPHQGTKPHLALPFVCRQIYQEAWAHYYTPDHLCFTKVESMLGLLFEAGWAARSDLHTIWIFLGGRWSYRNQSYEGAKALWEALHCLVLCKYLRRLKIFIEDDWHQESNLWPDFILPLREMKGVEIIVNSDKPRAWDYGEEDWEDEGEAHQWKLVEGKAGSYFEAEDGNIDDREGDFWSQHAVQSVPRLKYRGKSQRWNNQGNFLRAERGIFRF